MSPATLIVPLLRLAVALAAASPNSCMRTSAGCSTRIRSNPRAGSAWRPTSAEELLAHDVADAMAFGRLYIANPDLVARFASAAGLNPSEPSTLYFGKTKGYTEDAGMSARIAPRTTPQALETSSVRGYMPARDAKRHGLTRSIPSPHAF